MGCAGWVGWASGRRGGCQSFLAAEQGEEAGPGGGQTASPTRNLARQPTPRPAAG